MFTKLDHPEEAKSTEHPTPTTASYRADTIPRTEAYQANEST